MKKYLKRSGIISKVFYNYKYRKILRSNARSTKFGFKMYGPDNMVSGEFEKAETELFLRIIDQFDVFVNIGANIGYYTLLALQKGLYTLAFEPVKENVDILLKNLNINQFSSYEIFPVALSDHSGVQKIYGAGTGASLIQGWADNSETYSSLVPLDTLDNILQSRLANKQTLFLADIEGAEYFMLKGAQQQFSLLPDATWIVEISVDEHQPAGVKINPLLTQTFDLFWNNGYKAFTFTHVEEVHRSDIKQIMETESNHLNTHNFIFSKSTDLFQM